MPFDGLFLSGVRRELNHKLKQGRIEKIYQPARDEIILIMSRPGAKYRLLLSANAENARVHLTGDSRPNPVAPPMFCMLLRKHLEGGRVNEFVQPGLDRVLEIQVDCRDELGRPAVKSLICEIMGKHSNILLVNRADNTILDGIRRYSHAVSRHREVLPGRPYIPPPAQHKADPFSVTEDDFRRLLLAQDLDHTLAVALQKAMDGLSTPSCREIVKLAGLDPKLVLDHCGEYELRALWQSFQQALTFASADNPQAVLVCTPGGQPVDFFPVPVAQDQSHNYQIIGANEAIDEVYALKLAREELRKEKNQLLDRIKKETKRIRKKLALQEQSIQDAQQADQLRLYGELITANLHRVKRGMDEIALENYHDPEYRTVSIPLIPELSGAENAQHYFKKYNKAKNTISATQKIMDQALLELQYFEDVTTAIAMAENTDDVEEIRQELVSQGYLPSQATAPGKKPAKKARSKPPQYLSSDEFTILVGKNNRQNDTLTLKTAEDHDIWLHTAKIPGSHVIIRTNGREVPDRTILEAASLAAYFSKARESSNVPVDFTRRKHVKKPNGARPGYVIYEKQQTVFVNPGTNGAKLIET